MSQVLEETTVAEGNGRREIDAQDPQYLLAEGEHAGFRWVVAHNGMGHRCGYVRIPAGHPWSKAGPGPIGADAHGGVNWSERSGGALWIGFDCAHAHDLPDLSLPMPDPVRAMHRATYFSMPAEEFARWAVRTQEYVEAQCRSLCEQAAAALP